MRKFEIETTLGLNQTVSDDSDPGDSVQSKNPADEVIYTVTHDDDFNSTSVTVSPKVAKARIDLDLIQEATNFMTLGADEADLLPHALS